MRSLVLCVDRDNDIGSKTELEGPIIGRENNLRAAVLLGTKDPGDTDTNSIFAAINLYDRMKEEGQDVEIATITGDVNVGIRSDQILREQMMNIIEKINPKGVYFVSDGAEDEYILPIITSMVNVVHVERVVIKKQKTIEETYYAMVKILEDEKIQKKFLVPLAILILALSVITLTGYPGVGVALVGILFGMYLLIKAYKLEAPVRALFGDVREALETGRYITTAAIIIAVIVSFAGVIRAVVMGVGGDFLLTSINFVSFSLWYIIAGILIYMFGASIDIYIKEKRFMWSVLNRAMGLVGYGFVAISVLEILRYINYGTGLLPLEVVYYYTVIGFVILFFSVAIGRYIRDHMEPDVEASGTWLR